MRVAQSARVRDARAQVGRIARALHPCEERPISFAGHMWRARLAQTSQWRCWRIIPKVVFNSKRMQETMTARKSLSMTANAGRVRSFLSP